MTASMSIVAEVQTVLNGIIDPCSVRAGAAAGLVDMGLVHGVSAARSNNGWKISVVLGVTDPTCLMAAVFLQEATCRVAAILGVVEVVCTLDHSTIWTPKRLSPEYAQRLATTRSAQRAMA